MSRAYDLPRSRFSMADLKAEAIRRGLVASIGETTIWRWLSEDAIRPWRHRSWIFPRDPQFAEKAGRILDLYEGSGIHADCVPWVDGRKDPAARRGNTNTLVCRQRRAGRCGSSTCGSLSGGLGCPSSPYFWTLRAHNRHRPVRASSVMAQEPYRSAPRVFWIMDNPCPADGKMAQHRSRSYASPCQLAEPGGNLFLRDSAEGSDTE